MIKTTHLQINNDLNYLHNLYTTYHIICIWTTSPVKLGVEASPSGWCMFEVVGHDLFYFCLRRQGVGLHDSI